MCLYQLVVSQIMHNTETSTCNVLFIIVLILYH